MVGHARRRAHDRISERAVGCAVVAALLAVVAATAITAPPDKVGGLTAILGIAAVIAGLMAAGARDEPSVSASFIVYVLAAAFLGARSAMAAAVISELTAAVRMR